MATVPDKLAIAHYYETRELRAFLQYRIKDFCGRTDNDCQENVRIVGGRPDKDYGILVKETARGLFRLHFTHSNHIFRIEFRSDQNKDYVLKAHNLPQDLIEHVFENLSLIFEMVEEAWGPEILAEFQSEIDPPLASSATSNS